jgi:hypothetical protein
MNAHWMTRRLVIIPAAAVITAALVGVSPVAASASTCVSWTGTQPVNPGSGGDTLSAVAVHTPCDAWAVGFEQEGEFTQTLAEHWNGLTWATAPSSNPGGSSKDNQFIGVAEKSPSDAWAVGLYQNGTIDQTLIELLSGGTWEQVSSPDPGGSTNDAFLDGVAITSATNAWAVGAYTAGTQTRSLIVHWNGATWSHVRSPSPSASESELIGVTALSATNAWAVGFTISSHGFAQTLIVHWNGKAWTRVASPNPAGSDDVNGLQAVGASSASNAWAVGGYGGKGREQPLLAHWNGKTWKRVTASSLDNASVRGSLAGVTVLSTTDAWAVGSYGSPASQSSLAAHWNGKKWSLVPSPDLGSFNDFMGVAASSPTNIWAVGDYNTIGGNLAMAFHCC